MFDDDCACPPLADLMRLSLEGKANVCPVHFQPAKPDPVFALNDDTAISAAVLRALESITEGEPA